MGGVGGLGGLAMILVGSPGALLVLYWHSPLLLSMATPGQHYFPALLSSPTRHGHTTHQVR